jgi:malate/lactate dehydrogenase|tara:strand:- start:1095 stop:1223 length:129 start_codon:yes stop_codon:yes gene_type:complete
MNTKVYKRKPKRSMNDLLEDNLRIIEEMYQIIDKLEKQIKEV